MTVPSPENTSLTQTGRFGLQRRFEFISRRRLRVSERSRRKNLSYVIDIVAIDPRARSRVYVPWNWLALVLAGIAVTLAGWLGSGLGGVPLLLVSLASGIASTAGLVMMIRGTTRRRIFVSCHARLPLLDLELYRPDPKWFNGFVADLERRISDARRKMKLARPQQVAGEIRMLRRLSEAGALTPEVYQRAKSRLMKKF